MHDNTPQPAPLVCTQPDLDALARRVAEAATAALDTEFVRESTYYARLCLLQVDVDGEPTCVDPLAGLDLTPLWDALLAPVPLNLMHSARQDLELIRQHTGRLPGALFDTQIAAGLVGMPPQIGYAGLVDALLGVRLDKTHTRTDWSRRPLSPEQLGYAAEDVRHLPALHAQLQDRLVALGRLQWALEDCDALLAPALYRNPPEEAWQRIKGLRRLGDAARGAAAALAAWRERTAERLDRPRQWIMSDALLLAVAEARPGDVAALQRVAQMPAGLVRHRAADILAALGSGTPAPAESADHGPLDDDGKRRLDALARATRARAGELGLDPQLLATRTELARIARGDTDVRPFSGWRDGMIGVQLREVAGT